VLTGEILLDIKAARAILKAHNLRATGPRIVVLRTLARQSKPVSHSQLLALLPQGEFDAATVYRNLTRLTAAGILRIVSRAGGMARYERIAEKNPSPHQHPHFVCSECNEVSCLPTTLLPPVAIQDSWKASLASASVQFSGSCPDCIGIAP